MTYTVYQHRNLKNGKSYIGMTSLEPKRRWNNGLGYKNQSKMWSDIQNSDWNKDWEHNIIGQFEDKQEALNIEGMFIRLFDSTNEDTIHLLIPLILASTQKSQRGRFLNHILE